MSGWDGRGMVEGGRIIRYGVNSLRSTPQTVIQTNFTVVCCLTIIIIGLLSYM